MKNITLKNIKSFIDGNIKNIIHKTVGLPEHIKEQYYYRLYLCKDDCLESGKCKVCGCPTMLKAFTKKACNPDRLLDLMPGGEWLEYKKKNNINDIIFSEIKKLIDERK